MWNRKNGLSPQAIQEDGVLIIKNIQHEDSGLYTCHAEFDTSSKQRISVIVRGKSISNISLK